MDKHIPLRAMGLAVALGLACLALPGCRIEHKSAQGGAASASQASASASGGDRAAFDADAQVRGLWDSKALPAIDQMAIDYRQLKKEMAAGLDAAGARHGHREKGEGAPWNLAARISGKIVDADTELRAGTADVDVDGDGKADLQLQMGPVVKGTTLRDILPFISFSSYTNQIDFAQLANALNAQAFDAALKTVDRANLKGRTVDVTGVFTTDNADDTPVVTVVAFRFTN